MLCANRLCKLFWRCYPIHSGVDTGPRIWEGSYHTARLIHAFTRNFQSFVRHETSNPEDFEGFVPHSTSSTRLNPKFPEFRAVRNFEIPRILEGSYHTARLSHAFNLKADNRRHTNHPQIQRFSWFRTGSRRAQIRNPRTLAAFCREKNKTFLI